MHPKDDILRASLDGQLSQSDQAQMQKHLAACPRCQKRHEVLKERAESVYTLLNTLQPQRHAAPRPAASAIRKLREKEYISMSKSRFTLFRRPLWSILTLVAVLAVALSFQPVRALASSLLSLFRVQQVTVLPLEMSTLRSFDEDPTLGKAISQLFADSTTVIREPGETQEAASAEEASQKAGFTVRLPAGAPSLAALTVESGMAYEFVVDRQQAQGLLDQSGYQDLQLPESLDGNIITLDIPDGVRAAFGNCIPAEEDVQDSDKLDEASFPGEDCTVLLQLPSPVVSAPPGIELAQLAEIGLRFLGMSADEARDFSQKIDWSSTLVIPLPRGEVETEEVTIDGVTGSLIRDVRPQSDDIVHRYTLVWVRDGILYTLMGSSDPAAGLALANSLE